MENSSTSAPGAIKENLGQNFSQRFKAFAQGGRKLDPIFTEIATRLCDRLLDTKKTFALAVDIGAGRGSVGKSLPKSKVPDLLIEADFSAEVLKNNSSPCRLLANGEAILPFAPQTFDLVTSNLVLPWVRNVPRFLAQAGRILKEDGLFLGNTLGAESFIELQTAFFEAGSKTPHINPMPDVNTVGETFQSVGFALPVIDRDILTLEYGSFKDLWADMKAMGITNIHPRRNPGLTTPRLLEKAENIYREKFALPGGNLPLTLEVIYLHGWRPHKSQQKPLPRGSGKVDFSEVL